jgi:hypothetical protein
MQSVAPPILHRISEYVSNDSLEKNFLTISFYSFPRLTLGRLSIIIMLATLNHTYIVNDT